MSHSSVQRRTTVPLWGRARSVIMMGMGMILLIMGGVSAQVELEPDAFSAGMEQGEYDAVIDVRTLEEWNEGHIANATLIENLASDGTADDIVGCKACTIAVYCRSGRRAGEAIVRLQTEYGFTGTLYNALGVSQWTEAGYPLVADDSTTPPCALFTCDSCRPDCPVEVEEEDTTQQDKDSAGSVVVSTVASIIIPAVIMVMVMQL